MDVVQTYAVRQAISGARLDAFVEGGTETQLSSKPLDSPREVVYVVVDTT